MTPRHAFRVVVTVFCAVTLQGTVLLDVRIGGVHPDVMVLLPVAAGLAGGPAQGATVGFWTGLVADLFLPTPFGLSALVGTLVGFGVGASTAALDRTVWWLPPLVALVGSAAYELAYPLLGTVLGQPQMLHVPIADIVVLVGVVNAVLAAPAVRVVAWALPEASTEGLPTSSSTVAGWR
ncbi:MAG: rod shape-determining protein MreD [Actinomycetota bacterium]|nr:rod shape-determining protein MreD [Actinomycetota bacterium]